MNRKRGRSQLLGNSVFSCGSITHGPPAAPDPGVPKMSAAFPGTVPSVIGVDGKSVHIPWHGIGGGLLPPKPPRPVALPAPAVPDLVESCLTPAHPSASANEPIIGPSRRARFIGDSLP